MHKKQWLQSLESILKLPFCFYWHVRFKKMQVSCCISNRFSGSMNI